MSSFNPSWAISRSFKAALFVAMAALMALGVGGCAFQPLYGPTANGQSLPEVMKQVSITTIPSRVGQRVRNELIFGTAGGDEALPPVYRLDIVIKESVRNTLVTRAGDPTGQIYELNAEFRLVRIKDNEMMFKGASTATAAYDLAGLTGNAGSVYGDIRARTDAENRAARQIADVIKTRIAAFLSRAA